MAYSILINSVERAGYCQRFRVEESLGSQRSTADLFLRATDDYAPSEGQEIHIYSGDDKLFSGLVYSVAKRINVPADVTDCDVSCVDYTRLFDRRSAGEYEWVDKTCKDIILDILTDSMTDEAIGTSEGSPAVSTIATGPTLGYFSVKYPSVAEALNAVCEAGGLHWYVDYARVLHVFSTASPEAAPFGITGTNCRNLTLRTTSADYANRVIVIVGQYLLEGLSETFDSTGRHGVTALHTVYKTDSSRTSFPCSYSLASAPIVSVDGVEQAVGINGVDTGMAWYWNAGSASIEQDSGGTPLTAAQSLNVLYTGQDQAVTSAENATEIADRVTIEGGGSGVYVKVIEANTGLTMTQAQELAAAMLAGADSIPIVASIETTTAIEPLVTQLSVGQQLTINVAAYGASFNAIVRAISAEAGLDTGGQVTYTIEAVSGPLAKQAIAAFGQGGGGGTSAAGAASGDQTYQLEYIE